MTGTLRRFARDVGGRARARPRASVIAALGLAVLLVAGLALVSRGGGSSRPPTGDQADGPVAGAAGDGGPAAGDQQSPGGADGQGAASTPAAGGAAAPSTTLSPGTSPGAATGDPGQAFSPGIQRSRDPVADPAPVSLRPPVRCTSTGQPSAPPLPSADEQNGKRWVAAGRLAGSCDASSPTFALRGIDTRLVWRSDAASFVALLVDAVRGTDASAGFADAQCTGTCSEVQAIVPQAGTYSLRVQAGAAPWEIEVQEYR